MSKPTFSFDYDEKWYSVQAVETVMGAGTHDDVLAMRAEYTRMRDTAQKRIKRLGEQFSQSKAYQNHPKGFSKLNDIDPRDFPKAFSELAKFVKAKGSTVTGQKSIKEKTIRTWQEQGLNLNKSNYDKVIRILEEMRKQKIVYGSDKAVELANTMLELDDQQTNEWLNHLDTLLQHTDELQSIPEVAGYTTDEILEMIGD